jgi:hypothetical protein
VGGVISAAVASAEWVDLAHATSRSVASMATARAAHGAFLLPSGDVLVFGGVSSGAPTDTSELYDPRADVWRDAGTMHAPRSDFAALYLTNGPWAGQLLVIGGTDGTRSLDTSELFDPATGLWSELPAAMLHPRASHGAVQLSDGRVLVVGGNPGGVAPAPTAELLGLDGHWSPAPMLSSGLEAFTLHVLADDTVLLAGGTNVFNPPVASVERLGGDAGVWTDGGTLAVARHSHVGVVLFDGRIVILGGETTVAAGAATPVVEAFTP